MLIIEVQVMAVGLFLKNGIGMQEAVHLGQIWNLEIAPCMAY